MRGLGAEVVCCLLVTHSVTQWLCGSSSCWRGLGCLLVFLPLSVDRGFHGYITFQDNGRARSSRRPLNGKPDSVNEVIFRFHQLLLIKRQFLPKTSARNQPLCLNYVLATPCRLPATSPPTSAGPSMTSPSITELNQRLPPLRV